MVIGIGALPHSVGYREGAAAVVGAAAVALGVAVAGGSWCSLVRGHRAAGGFSGLRIVSRKGRRSRKRDARRNQDVSKDRCRATKAVADSLQ
ncbi:unnamed protein product [Ectocarpus sp. CCAP 1310/34]|nr:unnamed protein product [Ectocarpus sp. CCAP 1310/34]